MRRLVDFKAVAAKGCFVYCYLREKDSKTACAGTPYYIGFASRARRPFERHDVPIPPRKSGRVRVLKSGLSEFDAYKWEIFFIERYGRKDLRTGILLNKTGGGEGSLHPSPELRQLWSQQRLGVEKTNSHRQAISEALTGRVRQERGWVKTTLEKSYAKISPPCSFEQWSAMHKDHRQTYVKQIKAADFLGISLDEYHSLTRGERISRTRIKKQELGILGTKKAVSLKAA